MSSSDRREIASMTITLSLKTLVTVAAVVFTIVAASVTGYFRLDAKAEAGVIAKDTLTAMQCDIRQLKNYMVYGVKPDPRYDRCDGGQTYAGKPSP